MAIFEAHDLHLRFGDRVVLENISLAFEQGKLSGLPFAFIEAQWI